MFLCERRSDPPGLLLGRLDIGTSLLKGHTLSRHYHSLCLRRTPPGVSASSPVFLLTDQLRTRGPDPSAHYFTALDPSATGLTLYTPYLRPSRDPSADYFTGKKGETQILRERSGGRGLYVERVIGPLVLPG